MTNTIAENYVNESLNVMTESITTSTNSCSSSVQSGQFNIINGGNSQNCTITSNANINTTVDMSCYASTDVQNQVSNNLLQSAKVVADSTNQQFGFFAFSEAINIINGYINISTIMDTTFYNSCITNISNNQVNVVNCEGSNNMTVDINFNDTINLTQDCVFNNVNVNNASNDIKQSITAKAKAEIENYIAGIITAVLGVLIVVGLILFLLLLLFKVSGSKKDKPQIIQSGGNEDLLALAALTNSPSNTSEIIPTTPLGPVTTPPRPIATPLGSVTNSNLFRPSDELISQGRQLAGDFGNSLLEHPSVSEYLSTPLGQQATTFLSEAAGNISNDAIKALFS